jgi:UDP-N-acetylglucosamine--N-acetylmuramyl-(pentapeptide) pyrophosphoryl-undecaprenol N-acetylglucosamine transferase
VIKNLSLPFKILKSFLKVNKLIKRYQPAAAIGVGGYASGPLLFRAAAKNIPVILQEQNSYPGITNKILAKKADIICVAYPGMEKFFPPEKIILTGNPVRHFKPLTEKSKAEAQGFFGLDNNKKAVLIIGGSLGARTLNESLLSGLDQINKSDIQVIWQTGKQYFDSIREQVPENQFPAVHIFPFIERMDLAYAAADVTVSRAGAISISELALMGKPCILVPSPNVAEDHQTKNAMALVNEDAAIFVKDDEAQEKLVNVLINLVLNPGEQQRLKENISRFARPDAANDIALIIDRIIAERQK